MKDERPVPSADAIALGSLQRAHLQEHVNLAVQAMDGMTQIFRQAGRGEKESRQLISAFFEAMEAARLSLRLKLPDDN